METLDKDGDITLTARYFPHHVTFIISGNGTREFRGYREPETISRWDKFVYRYRYGQELKDQMSIDQAYERARIFFRDQVTYRNERETLRMANMHLVRRLAGK
jgi:hypothetical protein